MNPSVCPSAVPAKNAASERLRDSRSNTAAEVIAMTDMNATRVRWNGDGPLDSVSTTSWRVAWRNDKLTNTSMATRGANIIAAETAMDPPLH